MHCLEVVGVPAAFGSLDPLKGMYSKMTLPGVKKGFV